MAEPRCRDCGGTSWNDEGRCADCRAFPTLGYQVADWIEAHCAIPDGERVGQDFLLTDEQLRFLLWHYRIRPDARFDRSVGIWRSAFFFSRGSQLIRPQKWGKGPLSAGGICAEASPDGPVLFGGWDAEGQPVGRSWPTPWIQVAALSEDQTDNVWTALVPMIELGALAADIPDTGLTRINLPNGGKIEPVTSSANSRLGQRITFAVQDETHSWTVMNGGRKVADTQRRNLAGMSGRWLETTNAWDPVDDSVAQQTFEGQEPGVHLDDVEPGAGSVRNKADRKRMLKKVYGDSHWVDKDRIDEEIVALLKRDPAQAERFYLNRKQAGESVAFDPDVVDSLERKIEVPDRSLLVIGVDGARFRDALAMVATVVEGPKPNTAPINHQFPLGIWEKPESESDEYEHPFVEIDGAMEEAMDRFDVWRVYVDPQYIEHLLEHWQGEHGEKKVLKWLTSRPKQIAWAVRNYSEAIGAREVTHNGDEDFVRHLKNARKRKSNVHDDEHRQMHTLAKESPDSRLKMDGAMAATLSWEARGDCIAAGKPHGRGKAVAFM